MPTTISARFEPFTPRIIALILLAALLVAVVTGCQNQSSTSAPAAAIGAYTLVSVNHQPVPCQVMHGATAMTVKSGTFTLNADGTCRSVIIFALPKGHDVIRDVKATYRRDGTTLTMQWQGAGRTTGQISSNGFTMKNEGMTFTYKK